MLLLPSLLFIVLRGAGQLCVRVGV